MENHGLYDAMLVGLDDVHLSVRARKQAESNMRRAAAFVALLGGKTRAERPMARDAANADATHAKAAA